MALSPAGAANGQSIIGVNMDHISTESLSDSPEIQRLFHQARNGNRESCAKLVQEYRDRLKLLVSVRIDPRVAQRMDDSDVIQELFFRLVQDQDRPPQVEQVEASQVELSPYLWLRRLVVWTLGDMQRKHLGVQQRDPRREIPLNDKSLLGASSLDIAKLLIGSDTRPLDVMVRIERERALEKALEELEPIDREILMLRHGEQLSRSETARVLNISVAAAAKRYTRALSKVRQELKEWEQ